MPSLHIEYEICGGQLVAFNRKINQIDKVENFFKKMYSSMGVSITLYIITCSTKWLLHFHPSDVKI